MEPQTIERIERITQKITNIIIKDAIEQVVREQSIIESFSFKDNVLTTTIEKITNLTERVPDTHYCANCGENEVPDSLDVCYGCECELEEDDDSYCEICGDPLYNDDVTCEDCGGNDEDL